MNIAWCFAEAELNGATGEQVEQATLMAEEAMAEPIRRIFASHNGTYTLCAVIGLEQLTHFGAIEQTMRLAGMEQEHIDLTIGKAIEALFSTLSKLAVGPMMTEADQEHFEGYCETLLQQLTDGFSLALAAVQLEHPMEQALQRIDPVGGGSVGHGVTDDKLTLH